MSHIIKRILTSVVLLSLIYLSFIGPTTLLILLIIINLIALSEFNQIFKRIFKKKLLYIFLAFLLMLIYLTFFSLIIWLNLNSSSNFEIMSIIFLLLICISTDIGGFIFGKIIGGKKLTKISPNKTYAGMIGSFILSLIFGLIFFNYQENILLFKINVLIIIVSVSFISQIGDLIISFLKRKAKIKDTGSILPGHGGILDRIDGILIAIPFGVLLISI